MVFDYRLGNVKLVATDKVENEHDVLTNFVF